MLEPDQIRDLVESYGQRELPDFVISATVASELGRIISLAQALSLSSKNANVITVRAGDWGLGFSGLTQFIDEYARRTIECARRINQNSRQISARSVRRMFHAQIIERLEKVTRNQPNLAEMLSQCRGRLAHQVSDTDILYESSQKTLSTDISEMKACIRALSSMVPICRIEAARAGPYKDSLSSIADVIERQTTKLQQALASGQRVLDLAA